MADPIPVERITNRETLPRFDRGMDWGAERRLIARRGGDVLLFVTEGHWHAAAGVRGFGRTYAQSALILWTSTHPRFAGHHTQELAKGRISRMTLVAAADAIDAAFGTSGLAGRLDLSRTLAIGDAAAVGAARRA